MPAPDLTNEEADALIDELADALEEMIDRTCVDMAPLWVEATRDQRAYLDARAFSEIGFTPSERYRQLSKGARSKYRGLAAWRHAVIWRSITDRICDSTFRDAMVVVYFTPFPDNEPPYAWSRSAADAPGVERLQTTAQHVKDLAKEGCALSLGLLRVEQHRLEVGKGFASELRGMLLRPATRDSLRDVLKLEDPGLWESAR